MTEKTRRGGLLARMSIRRKLTWAFVIVLGLFIGATAASFSFARILDDARQITNHTYEVLVATGDLRSAMWAQESGLRGYVITNDRHFLTPYEQGSKAFRKALNQMRRLTSDNPAQQERLNRIAETEQRWQTEIVAPEFELLKLGRIEEAQQVIADGDGDALLETLRDLFKQLELAEYQLLAEREGNFSNIRQRAVLTMTLLLGLGLLIGLMAMFAVSRQVTLPLAELTGAMRGIANGDLETNVPHRARGDEVGAIAEALEHFREISVTNEAVSWVRNSLNTLRLSAQKAENENDLAQGILDLLVPMVNARYAAFFIFDEKTAKFNLIAGYGYPPGARENRSFAMGEGLVGQCAANQAPMVLTDLPKDYVSIESGLGSARPNQLILAPAIYSDEVVAVIELALFERYRSRHAHLVEEVLPTTALSLLTLRRHIKTQELLEETRAQSEELQASEEELRNQQEQLHKSNEELRRQSDEVSKQAEELRASEEELTAQSEELRATNEELREKGDLLESRKNELELARDELENKAEALAQASKYKSEFLANMSHELRTPLNSLLILARSLADNDSGHLDEEEVEAANIVHDSGANLLRLINDILDLSKVEAGKMQAHMEPVLLKSLRDRLQRNFAHVAQEKGLEFSVSIAAGLPDVVQTDSGKLEQIINNLLANAFKFTKEGGIEVQIQRPPADMQLRTPGLTAGNAVAIAISDQGIGIPEDKLDKIFQDFEQVDASTSRVYGGTGLGLSISQRLAQLLGGEVHVDSVKDQGSTFTVVIPEQGTAAEAVDQAMPESVTEAQVDAATNPDEQAPPRLRPAAILPAVVPDDRDDLRPGERCMLVIEDDEIFAKVLRDDARRKNFKCLVAGDGESGLELAKIYRPTGILLDIGLPGIDGWAVLDRLKAQSETRHIPVHILSAGDDTGRGEELGAIGFLPKPATREGLEEVFARVVKEAGGQKKRLLVVDDDAAARAAVKVLLKNADIDIRYADNAERGLAALAETRHDCVVLDLNLPDMSGFELLERINEKENAPPVIVYSARQLTDEENLRLRSQTDSIVVKGAHSQKRLLDEVTLFMHSIKGPAVAAAKSPRVADKDLSGKTVLLVDDDMRNTFALSRVLRGKGLKVLMAQDGYKALDQLEQNPDLDIVLMDIMMPGIDGYETMRRIRAQSQFGKLPILALTAKAMKGDREKCIEAGASDYLSKPIDTDKLLSMMRAWT